MTRAARAACLALAIAILAVYIQVKDHAFINLDDNLYVTENPRVQAGVSMENLRLGVIGFARVLVWQGMFGSYGDQALGLGLTVAVSLVGVVTFGSLAGSTLPLVLKSAGFDPAVASAPLVATLVDVSGVIIYFAAASLLLFG